MVYGLSQVSGVAYNENAIRVVDLKTKETKTLPIKGLQPPSSTEAVTNTDAAPNAEEIKLLPQKVRAGEAAVLINVELPAGYHLNPTAPQQSKMPARRERAACDSSGSIGTLTPRAIAARRSSVRNFLTRK